MSTLAGKPASALWLLRHELRLFWRRGAVGPKTGLVFAFIFLAMWFGISMLILSRVGDAIPPPPLGHTNTDGIVLAGISLVLTFVGSVMVSQSILRAVDVIYTRNDLDLLLSSPMKPWTILVVRTAAIAIGLLPIDLALLAPPVIALSIFNSPLWLSAIIGVSVLAFATSGLGLLVVTALFRLIGPKRTRVIAQIFAALSGAAVFLGFQYFNLVGGRGFRRGSSSDTLEWFNQLHIDADAPWFIPARAMTGDVLQLILLVILCFALFALGVFIFSRSFIADAAAASTMGQPKRTKDADVRVAAVRGGVMPSVIRKELRLLYRDPVLLSQIGLQIVYLVPLAFVLLRPNDDGQMSIALAGFAPMLTLLASSLAGSLIWITVSAEDAPDLIASAPVRRQTVDRGKVLAAVIPVAAAVAIPVIALSVQSLAAGLWAIAGCLMSATAAALIGIWRRTPTNRKDFVRRRASGSTTVALGQTFVAMGIAASAGFGAYGLPYMAIIPAVIWIALLGALYRDPSLPPPEPAKSKPKKVKPEKQDRLVTR